MGNSDCKRVLLLLSIAALFNQTHSLDYTVHWLEGPTTIERDVPSAEQPVDIYCYNGTSKNLFALYRTAQCNHETAKKTGYGCYDVTLMTKFHIKIINDKFRLYKSSSPEEVYKKYTEESDEVVLWKHQMKIQKTESIRVFAPTCMAVNTSERHTIDLQILRVDLGRVLLMVSGIILILSSRTMNKNPLGFYLFGIFIGVSVHFIFVVLYVWILSPRDTLTNQILIGGYSILYILLFEQTWEYETVMIWYTYLVDGFVSFLMCYSIGPPKNHRRRNEYFMWIVQAVGVLMIFSSSEYEEVSVVVFIATLVAEYSKRGAFY